MEKTGQGVLSQNDLMQRLVQAKKVLNKVETGDFERGNVNEEILRSNPEDIQDVPNNTVRQPQTSNIQKIQDSKLPEAIKRAMIENPIPQISLSDSLDLNFIEKTKKLMESEGVATKKTTQSSKSSTSPQVNSSDLVKQLTPIIENIVRKTVMEIMDTKLNQILTAQQTLSINENLVLKVGDSIFKGKITGVNKSK
jgi:hypothetical protein